MNANETTLPQPVRLPGTFLRWWLADPSADADEESGGAGRAQGRDRAGKAESLSPAPAGWR